VAITSMSVVDVGQRGVIERFGRPLSEEPIGAGMTAKYPWPIERTYRFDVGQSRRIVLGFAEERPHRGEENGHAARPVLWTNREHGEFEEIDILVATPRSELRVATEADLEDGRGRSVPVSIFRAVASVEFRVRDVFAFGYEFSDGTALLKGIAQRELVRYAAASAVGGVGLAERLATAIREADTLSRSTDPGDRTRLEQAEKLRDGLMAQASGQVSKLLADASAERIEKVNRARGHVEKFRKQLVAYQAAPTYFEWMKYFDTLSRRLADARKYLLAFDPQGRKVMLILNTEEEERIRFESQ
jgi:hypothetical protein